MFAKIGILVSDTNLEQTQIKVVTARRARLGIPKSGHANSIIVQRSVGITMSQYF